MKTKKLFDLPIPQSGCGHTRFQSDGVSATLEFEYRVQGEDLIGLIQFQGVVAHRFRDELHSLGYASEAYEAVAEVCESEWCETLRFNGKHIAVFLSSNGYFEVLAEEFLLERRERVFWTKAAIRAWQSGGEPRALQDLAEGWGH